MDNEAWKGLHGKTISQKFVEFNRFCNKLKNFFPHLERKLATYRSIGCPHRFRYCSGPRLKDASPWERRRYFGLHRFRFGLPLVPSLRARSDRRRTIKIHQIRVLTTRIVQCYNLTFSSTFHQQQFWNAKLEGNY